MKRVAAVLAVGLLVVPAEAQQAPPRFRSKTEVSLRIVRVVLTTPDGKPLPRPPSPNDLEVVEGGREAEILDVERLFTAEAPGAPPIAAREAPPPAAMPAPSALPVHHVIYVETTFLSTPGLRDSARALAAAAPRLAARGTVEIVVADPDPRPFLEPTRDAAAIGAALDRVGATVVARDWLAKERTLESETAASTTFTQAQMERQGERDKERTAQARARVFAERTVAGNVLDRLTRWASRREPEPGGVFLLVSDGFDIDPTGFSRKLQETDVRATRGDLIGPDVSLRERWADVTALLGGLGFAVFPLAAGAERFFGAAESGSRSPIDNETTPGSQSIGRAFLAREEPLTLAAAATGGEVSTSGDKVIGSLDRLSESYLVTFHTSARADGKIHALTIRSKRPDIRVRGPASIAGGTPDSIARALVLGILGGDAAPSELGVEAALDRGSDAKKPSTLRIRIKLANVPDLLAGADGKLRVSVAVAHAKDAPFVNHAETPLTGSGGGRVFVYEAPLSGVSTGDHVAVLVEELETGFAGGTTLAVAAPPAH